MGLPIDQASPRNVGHEPKINHWEGHLSDMDRHIELFPGHDPEEYKLRA